MNPFLVDPVARPIANPLAVEWNDVMSPRRSARPFRYRAGRLAVAAAGLGAGLSGGFAAYALDVNVASVAELERLRGIGPRTAQMIIQERTRAGAFESLSDLSDRVRGLGAQRVRVLQGLGLRAGSAGSSSPENPLGVTQEPRDRRASRLPVRDTVTPELLPGRIIPAEHK
ncbi:helix-hairpin-helix domain-containing protein [Alcaligenaceae bacterium LF4-65]|jgi:competence protein ComEA|uniref:Helix-hairpin-helix domain-containing protein n=1 Tax=Zwartia hollandica TaxID=324606 RepID=A0A953T3J3_9BURK|nr:helix-hairpin-helix domain-containing protein [Zwartia hollandica]MBZ1349446.1 helix-hairpin-helix domain-containing protein [Zwartia hollandica]